MTKLEKLYSIIENSREVGVKLVDIRDRHVVTVTGTWAQFCADVNRRG